MNNPRKRSEPCSYKVVYTDGYIEEGDIDVSQRKLYHVRQYYKRSEASSEYRKRPRSKSPRKNVSSIS